MSSWSTLGYKDTLDFYADVHKRMIANYRENAQTSVDENNAKYLQKFLYNLKNLSSNSSNPIEGILNEEYLKIAEEATKNMPRLKAPNKLFNRAHNRNQKLIQGADDIFEQELYGVIRALEKIAVKDITINTKNQVLTGQVSGNIADELVKTTLTEGEKKIISVINKTKGNSNYTGPVARSIKTDLQNAFSEINVEAQVKTEYQQIFSILKDATFSLKNYSSFYYDKTNQKKIPKDMVSLHLGSTDVFKAFMGGLSFLGYPAEVSKKALFAGYNLHHRYKNQEIGTHIYHIRFLYELTGAGLYDEEGNNLQEVKYLIWNDPDSDNIKVFSTKSLINSLLDGKIQINTNPFGKVYLKV